MPEGVTKMESSCNYEIHVPVTALPVECIHTASDLPQYFPASVTEIAEELEYDSDEMPFKAIYAPAGSYAEQYAKEHGIPFVVE